VKSGIKKRTNVDVDKFTTVKAVRKMNPTQTVIFLAARNDELVNPKHTEKLYNAFRGAKKALIMVDGGHNSYRNS